MSGQTTIKKKEKQFTNIIKDLNLSFDITEQWNNNFIGYCQIKNVLIFIKLNNQEFSLFTVEINQLKSCQINATTQTLVKDNKSVSSLDTVDLEVIMQGNQAPLILNFYDSNEEFTEDLELKRAQKWEALIKQNTLKPIVPPKAA
jgi:hypothetical protein